MTNLTQIIEKAFEAGWQAYRKVEKNEEIAKFLGDVTYGRSYQHYLNEELNKYESSPFILTKQIFDEIFNRFCIHGMPYPSAMQVYCELGGKYNLLTEEELEPCIAKPNGESND